MIIALAALVGVAVLAVLREGAPRGKTADSVTPEPAFEHARGSVVRTLAIAEGKLLARNPLVIAGVVLSGMSMFAVGRGTRLFHDDMGVALMLFPLAGMTLIASDLAVLRGEGMASRSNSAPARWVRSRVRSRTRSRWPARSSTPASSLLPGRSLRERSVPSAAPTSWSC